MLDQHGYGLSKVISGCVEETHLRRGSLPGCPAVRVDGAVSQTRVLTRRLDGVGRPATPPQQADEQTGSRSESVGMKP